MNPVYKEYDKYFVLESTKLTSIVAKVHERLKDYSGAQVFDRFEVQFQNRERMEYTSLDAVLELPNSSRRKIARVIYTGYTATDDTVSPSKADEAVTIDFSGPSEHPSRPNVKVISIQIRSDSLTWASRVISEVEEQLERTWQRIWPTLATLLSITFILAFIGLSQIISMDRQQLSSQYWLSTHDLPRVKEMLSHNSTLTDEENRELTTMQLRNFYSTVRSSDSNQGSRAKLVLLVPVLIVLLVVAFLLFNYPKAVFLWGDEVERTAERIQRRRLLWGIIISILVIGVANKLAGGVVERLITPK